MVWSCSGAWINSTLNAKENTVKLFLVNLVHGAIKFQAKVSVKINDFIRWLNVKTYKMSKKAKLCILYATILQAPEWAFAKVPEPV